MNLFFLDTSYIIALELKDDQYHQEALEHWQTIARYRPNLVTISYIFDEVITFFSSRQLHSKAIEIGNRLLYDSSVNFIEVDSRLFGQAYSYFKKHKDKTYSLTDCISFIVMQQLEVSSALTFDKHFLQAGFQKLP